MTSLRKTLLSPWVIGGVMAAAGAGVAAGGLVPQRFIARPAEVEAWRAAHRPLLPLVDLLGLDHAYTTPWFAAIILAQLLLLVLSAEIQFREACRRTFGAPAAFSRETAIAAGSAVAERLLRRRGYLRLAQGRYVKNVWGYWGSFLLHAGMVVVIAAALQVALTEQRGVLFLTEGEIHPTGAGWVSEEHGMLAGPLRLAQGVRLERLQVGYRDDGTVAATSSDVTLFPAAGPPQRVRTAVNDIVAVDGIRLYQSTDFGDAFLLEIVDAAGSLHRERLQIYHPLRDGAAGYNDFELPWLAGELSAKYEAVAAAGSRVPALLVLRLSEGGAERARLPLVPGGEGKLGGMTVRLAGSERWSGIVFAKTPGTCLLFTGFALICVGGIAAYCTPAREIRLLPQQDGLVLGWQARRFTDFYTEEYREIVASLGGTA